MDAHVFGKNTLALFRSLFSFTHSLIICTGERTIPNNSLFENCHSFLSKGVNPRLDSNNENMPADF